jgi:hypothetical protein
MSQGKYKLNSKIRSTKIGRMKFFLTYPYGISFFILVFHHSGRMFLLLCLRSYYYYYVITFIRVIAITCLQINHVSVLLDILLSRYVVWILSNDMGGGLLIARIITGITYVSTFQISCLSFVRSILWKSNSLPCTGLSRYTPPFKVLRIGQ